jgi:hypothetical protein
VPHFLGWLLLVPNKAYKLISASLIVNFLVLGSTESLFKMMNHAKGFIIASRVMVIISIVIHSG